MTTVTETTEQMFGDMSTWQAMLDRQRELFVAMDDGSRIGFVSREASGILPGKRLEGVQVVASEVPLMAWESRRTVACRCASSASPAWPRRKC
jgi:hypothetical protein